MEEEEGWQKVLIKYPVMFPTLRCAVAYIYIYIASIEKHGTKIEEYVNNVCQK